MARLRAVALAASAVMLAALCLPGAALAGTYTWSMPQNFTAVAPGANPDHDAYGATPWSYAEGPSGTMQFSAQFDGGLAGWTDNPTGSQAFAAVNPTGSPINGVGPGQFAMQPAAGGSVALAWTAPIAGTASVQGSVTQLNPRGSSCGFGWSLSQGSATIASGTDTGTIPSTSVSLQAAATLYLVLHDTSVSYRADCDTAVVTLGITMPSTPPTVTLNSPGQTISGAQPTLSGTAGGGFGAAGLVTVRIYTPAAGGARVARTLIAARVNGVYSVVPNPPLPNGFYAAQAEQDNLAGDRALSAGVVFVLNNPTPKVSLDSLGRKPLLLARPTFAGTAGTQRGVGSQVAVAIFAGLRPSKSAIRIVVARRSPRGRFTIRLKQGQGLPDGNYTAAALQGGPGPVVLSAPQHFQIKFHPPAVTLVSPSLGAVLTNSRPVIAGLAGSNPGDFRTITVVLYRGGFAAGKPLGTRRVAAKAANWSVTWPRSLPVGLYTVLAKQSDDAGHKAVTAPQTFFVTFPPQVIGWVVNLDRQGYTNVEVTCTADVGVCAGNVAALTTSSFQLTPGGPRRPLEVLDTYVNIPAGRSMLVRQRVSPQVAAALRAVRAAEVQVNAVLKASGDGTIRVSVARLLAAS